MAEINGIHSATQSVNRLTSKPQASFEQKTESVTHCQKQEMKTEAEEKMAGAEKAFTMIMEIRQQLVAAYEKIKQSQE